MKKIREINGIRFEFEDQWLVLIEIRHVSEFVSVFIFQNDSLEKFEIVIQSSQDGSWNFAERDAPLFKGLPSHWPGMTLLPWKEHECD